MQSDMGRLDWKLRQREGRIHMTSKRYKLVCLLIRNYDRVIALSQAERKRVNPQNFAECFGNFRKYRRISRWILSIASVIVEKHPDEFRTEKVEFT